MARQTTTRTELQKFLNAPANSRTRERIFFNKFYFDVKFAAARRGYPLTVFEPEVDREGFDVVIDDADNTRHLQLKSATCSAGTQQWITTPRFLRPNLLNIPRMRFPYSSRGEGLGGGVVLILIDDSLDDCPVSYFYTDLFVIAAFGSGLIRQTGNSPYAIGQPRRKRATRIMHQLYEEQDGNARLVLPRSVFLEVKSPDCLLTIAGLHSSEQIGHLWTENFAEVYQKLFDTDHTGNPASGLEKEIIVRAHVAAHALLTLVSEKKLSAFHSGIPDDD